MKLEKLAHAIGGELLGDGSREVTGAATLMDAGPNDLAFLANPQYEKYVADTKAAAVIVATDFSGADVPMIRCEDAYYAFREAMVLLFGFRTAPFEGVSASAQIHPEAKLGDQVAAAWSATVCAGATIGDRTVLYPGVFVGPDARIGSDCILHPNVVVYDHCVLGDRVTLHANTVIGQDGFGYATHEGAHHKIPPAGWAEIGDDVELGAGCTVDRSTMGATTIASGTKFSNQVAIGHGCRIGPNNLMVAQTGIAGSTTTGAYCVFGGQAGVVGHLKLGDFVSVGAQAGVTNDIPSNTQVWGTPASPLADAKRQAVVGRQLPKMRDRIRAIEQTLAQLKREASGDGERS